MRRWRSKSATKKRGGGGTSVLKKKKKAMGGERLQEERGGSLEGRGISTKALPKSLYFEKGRKGATSGKKGKKKENSFCDSSLIKERSWGRKKTTLCSRENSTGRGKEGL